MRCYHACNFYLAGIHAGIQTAHTQHELAIKYLASTPYRNLVADESLNEYGARLDLHTDAKADYINWANNHKTLILLNGGMASHLIELETFLTENSHAYAWASFREEEAALNGAITNVGIVLPEHMYRYTREVLKFVGNGFGRMTGGELGNMDIIYVQRAQDDAIMLKTITDDREVDYIYSLDFDIPLLQRLDRLKLMGA